MNMILLFLVGMAIGFIISQAVVYIRKSRSNFTAGTVASYLIMANLFRQNLYAVYTDKSDSNVKLAIIPVDDSLATVNVKVAVVTNSSPVLLEKIKTDLSVGSNIAANISTINCDIKKASVEKGKPLLTNNGNCNAVDSNKRPVHISRVVSVSGDQTSGIVIGYVDLNDIDKDSL